MEHGVRPVLTSCFAALCSVSVRSQSNHSVLWPGTKEPIEVLLFNRRDHRLGGSCAVASLSTAADCAREAGSTQ